MQVPGAPSLFFLFYLLVFLPFVAVRSARLREMREKGAVPRAAIWKGLLFTQAALLLLSWLVARTFDYEIFATPHLEPKYFAAAIGALVVCLALRWIGRALHSEEERRKLAVYAWAPRTPNERILRTGAVLLAAIAEEAAYRGVGMAILWYSLGNPWSAALISALAFSAAHAAQGWKSAITIFAIALVMHGLVAFTGTLILAMIVHASYDLVVGYGIARTARQYDSSVA
jgi:membrane protease YdiL (CAAX protease family)